MMISVAVKSKQNESALELLADGSFAAKVKAMPVDNKANLEIVSLLARYFKVPKVDIKLVRGSKSKIKVFEIIK